MATQTLKVDSIPIVAFTSGKGGCGKTTLAVNFANIISKAKQKVLLLDFDLANRGCTGLFSSWTKTADNYVTVTRLLRNDGLTNRPVLDVKSCVVFIPATSSAELPWSADSTDLNLFTTELRTNLQDLGRRVGAACIVLDCFCGIDVLTTAGVGVADDTLIINEPDIVTFSGALTLLAHLELSFNQLNRKPRLHFVINRLRSNFTVRELGAIYSDNLQRKVNEIVLCHFPYHPNIFETFGKYPFISDLLPGSLFVRKLELLSYLLFKGRADHLVKPAVLVWSKRKIRSIYNRSVDHTAVDLQFLVTRFTSFPLLFGLWLFVAFLLLRTVPLGPVTAWTLVLMLGAAISVIIASSFVYGCWLAARLNIALAQFRFRLGRTQKGGWSRTQYYIGAISPLVGSLFMGLSTVMLSIYLLAGVGYFVDWIFNVGVLNEPSNTLKERQINVALTSPIREVDLRRMTITDLDLGDAVSPGVMELGSSERTALINGVRFVDCRLGYSSKPLHLSNCTFDECQLNSAGDGAGTIEAAEWLNVTLTNCSLPPVLRFSNSKLTNVRFDLTHHSPDFSDVDFFSFDKECKLSGFAIAKDTSGTTLITFDGEHGRIPNSVMVKGKVECLTSNEFEDRIQAVSFAHILKDSEDHLAKLSNPVDHRGRLANLIELYILSNDSALTEKAEKHVEELRTGAQKDGDVEHEGIANLLGLLLSVVKQPYKTSASDTDPKLSAWCDWLEKNSHPKSWYWNTWNKYSPRLALTPSQLERVNAIEASAQGKLMPARLKEKFDRKQGVEILK